MKPNNKFVLLADYWKSNAKKYCDFCKCWITDNKPSVEFHEKGRRHQENVARRLKQITKNNRRVEIENVKVDAAMAQMESAALEAYWKDVGNNADITSQAINKRLQEQSAAGSSQDAKKVWREAKSPDGNTYYWNITTNESVWEPPKDGYLSIKEAKEADAQSTSKAWKEYHKQMTLSDNLKEQEKKKEQDEDRARVAREKLKERRVEEVPIEQPAPILEEGKTNPYGRWQTVRITEVEDVRPTTEEIAQSDEINEIVEAEPVPQKKFFEKTVSSLDDVSGISTQFKKRKMMNSFKRNTRPRVEDD